MHSRDPDLRHDRERRRVYNLADMLDRGLVQPPLFVQTVLGTLGGIGSDVEDSLPRP